MENGMQITQRLEKETAREYAYRIIKDNIVSLELPPGSKVSESMLAVELGVSRMPVHEALIILNEEGLVEVYPQRGSFISLIDSELVDEVRFFRLVLEKAIVELACDIATKEDLLSIKENLKLQELYSEENLLAKNLYLDNEFHRLLFVICKKENIYRRLRNMTPHFDRARNLSLTVTGDRKSISEHKAIVDAIEKKDKKLAEKYIVEHLSRYKVDEKLLKAKYPQYFKENPHL
jgi:GntR family transcriptional regulator, rspAB operon transcriptional repressor